MSHSANALCVSCVIWFIHMCELTYLYFRACVCVHICCHMCLDKWMRVRVCACVCTRMFKCLCVCQTDDLFCSANILCDCVLNCFKREVLKQFSFCQRFTFVQRHSISVPLSVWPCVSPCVSISLYCSTVHVTSMCVCVEYVCMRERVQMMD